MGYDALRSEAAAFLRLVLLPGRIEFFGHLIRAFPRLISTLKETGMKDRKGNQ
jgi:hypothetical protein